MDCVVINSSNNCNRDTSTVLYTAIKHCLQSAISLCEYLTYDRMYVWVFFRLLSLIIIISMTIIIIPTIPCNVKEYSSILVLHFCNVVRDRLKEERSKLVQQCLSLTYSPWWGSSFLQWNSISSFIRPRTPFKLHTSINVGSLFPWLKVYSLTGSFVSQYLGTAVLLAVLNANAACWLC